jgi:hypothetical protein
MTAYATREIIKIIVPLEDVDNVRHNGELAEIGGGSSVHGNRKDRMSNLKLDQLIGQLGEWAACHYLHGSSDAYYEMRDKRNANPHEGDGGVDGKSKLGVYDVKGSRCKLDGENIQNLNLLVPEGKEWRKNWIYIAAFAETQRRFNGWWVWLAGWAMSHHFVMNPPQPRHLPRVHERPDQKSYFIPVGKRGRLHLKPMSDLKDGVLGSTDHAARLQHMGLLDLSVSR